MVFARAIKFVSACLAVAWTATAAQAASISGQVYDARSGEPARGVSLSLVYDAEDAQSPDQPVPASALGPDQDGQVTGPDGRYRFDVQPGRRYRLVLEPRATSLSAPSALIPAQPGFAPAGPVVDGDTPAPARRPYFLRFELDAADDEVSNNHVPVDPLPALVTLDKRAQRPTASAGDVVRYTVTVTNRSARDLSAAGGRPVYVLDAPARGLAYLRGHAVARIARGDQVTTLRAGSDGFGDSFENPGSRRLVRFGPFDVEAGATLTLVYQVAVGLDTRPGMYENRASLVDAGGVELAQAARAQVRVIEDSTLESATVLGRVFCDDNGNDRFDPGERGVMGARVHIDTGSYAITDSAGLYHFSRVRPGTRLVKLDSDTLAGGLAAGAVTRLLRMSSGQPARADFAARCALELVDFDAHATSGAAATPTASIIPELRGDPPAERQVNVAGDVETFEVRVQGRAVELPRADITLHVPPALRAGERDLITVPTAPGGYSADARPAWRPVWTVPRGIGVARWELRIGRLDAERTMAPVRTLSGAGSLPAEIPWDGLDSAGAPVAGNALYTAQLVVWGSGRGAEAASPRTVFGASAPAPVVRTLRGQLFAGTDAQPTATADLHKEIAELARSLAPGDTVIIESHADGSGDRLRAITRTQREADLAAKLLVEQGQQGGQGVDADRVTGRGRGSLDPVVRADSAAARAQNRRLVITVIPAQRPATAIPRTASGSRDVFVNGQPVALDGSTFSHEMTLHEDSERERAPAVVVDMQAEDGRRAAISVALSVAPSDDANDTSAIGAGAAAAGTPDTAQQAPRTVEVSGDVDAGTLAAGDVSWPSALFQVDARLAGTAAGHGDADVTTTGAGAQRALSKPLDFELLVPDSVPVASWRLVIRDSAGGEIHAAAGQGAPPAVYTWRGTHDSGALAVTPGQRHAYRLEIETRAQLSKQAGAPARAMSPERWFLVDGAADRRVEASGALFTDGGRLQDAFSRQLDVLAARMAGLPDGHAVIMNLQVASAPEQSAASARLALAVRAASIKKYLQERGVAADRFEIEGTSGPEDRFSMVLPAAPAAARDHARVVIGGVDRALAPGDSAWRAPVELGPGQKSIPIDVTDRHGHRVIASVTAPSSTRAAPRSPEAQPIRELVSMKARAGRTGTVVELPRAGVVLGSPTLAVRGRTGPGNRVFAGGADVREIAVDSQGRFAGLVELPGGVSELVLEVRDSAGAATRLRRQVEVKPTRVFVMALGEGVASTAHVDHGWSSDSAYLDGMTEDSTVAVGPVRLHGRIALYLKGHIADAPLAGEVDVTAHVDTARPTGTGAFFEQLADLRHDQPVYGDSSQEVRDVNTRGKLYLQARTRSVKAVAGSVHTRLASSMPGDAASATSAESPASAASAASMESPASTAASDLFGYDRTMDGALVDIDKRAGGARFQARAFRAGSEGLQRDINLYRSTGGTLYYLRHGHVVEGSERVRVVVRDAHSGLAVSERELARNLEYTIDYEGGRVLLAQPLASVVSATWLLERAGAQPAAGNPVFVEVGYEHRQPGAGDDRAAGVYARGGVGGVSVGAGVVSEQRHSGADYWLWGADVRVKAGARSNVRLELAGSRHRDATTMLSADGGLSFVEDNHGGGGLGAAGRDMHLGWKYSHDLALGDFVAGEAADRARWTMHVQDVERGFSSPGAVFGQGRFKLGTELTYQLSERDAVRLRHQTDIASLPRVGPTAADIDAADFLATDELASHHSALQWSLRRGAWQHRVEAGHEHLRSTATLAGGAAAVDSQRLGLGGASAYALGDRITLRAGQRVVVGMGDADPVLDPIGVDSSRGSDALAGVTSNVGADLLLTEGVAVAADWYQRWNGDSAAQVGFRSALSETGSMYVRERLESRGDRLHSATVVGAEDRIAGTAGGRTYGEYQLENGVYGQRNRAVLGLGHRWQVGRGARVSAGFEHQQVSGGRLVDGTPVGDARRNVVHGGAEYTVPETLKAAMHAEVRFDSGGEVNDLALYDSRPIANPGLFADHGDPVPALVVPGGDRQQIVLGAGVDWKWARDHTFLGRFRASQTTALAVPGGDSDNDGDGDTPDISIDGNRRVSVFDYMLATAGWAYRPVDSDRINVLTRYGWVQDVRPGGAVLGVSEPGMAMNSRAHTLSVMPIADLPWRLTLAGKLAIKRTRATAAVDDEVIHARSDALLWLLRLGYRFHGQWDASAEVRGLHLIRPVDQAVAQGGEVTESRVGALMELGYSVARYVRLGVGYNLSHFSDDELGDLERDSHGFFVRLTGHY